MNTLAVTPAQVSVLAELLEVMSDFALDEDCDYTTEDLPVLRGEMLEFPTNSLGVVEDLLWRLDHNVADDEKRVAAALSRAICKAHGLSVFREQHESALRGAHPDLVRKGIFKGVDFNMLARRFWRLGAMRATGPMPKIRWRAPSRGDWVGGRAYVGRGRVIVRLTPGATIERAAEVVLHELVHMACPKGEHHGEVFRRRLIACANEAFGLVLDTATLLDLGPGKHGKRAYAIDEAFVVMMKEVNVGARLRASVPFEPAPVETEEQIASRRTATVSARVAERERHARAMLATWERKLAAAKTRASKWRTKVRGYERRQLAAAKKGGA